MDAALFKNALQIFYHLDKDDLIRAGVIHGKEPRGEGWDLHQTDPFRFIMKLGDVQYLKLVMMIETRQPKPAPRLLEIAR